LSKEHATAAVFCILFKYEAFGIITAEALAARTPRVVANSSALKDWVDNRNCFWVDHHNDPVVVVSKILLALGRIVWSQIGGLG
jgi:glycosyltransferase involved in cell wall biosynthesis